MGINDEIMKEYEKSKAENIVNQTLVENDKKRFAEMLLSNGIGNSINMTPIPIKKPFKMRFKEFIERLKKILWS